MVNRKISTKITKFYRKFTVSVKIKRSFTAYRILLIHRSKVARYFFKRAFLFFIWHLHGKTFFLSRTETENKSAFQHYFRRYFGRTRFDPVAIRRNVRVAWPSRRADSMRRPTTLQHDYWRPLAPEWSAEHWRLLLRASAGFYEQHVATFRQTTIRYNDVPVYAGRFGENKKK